MTAGSEVHDELSRHVKSCETCSKVEPIRVHPAPVGLCNTGWRIWMRWRDWCRLDD